MTAPFAFPSPEFTWAWVFCLCLLALLAIATEEDLRRMVIPKWVTIPMLVGGVVFNTVRGAFAAQGSWGWGMWEGFLVSLAGFGTAFGLFLLMWVLGTCGGGDVKLFAAVGAWVGWRLALYILVGTIILVVVLAAVKVIAGFTTGPRSPKEVASGGGPKRRGEHNTNQSAASGRRGLVSYALPVTLSTAIMLAIFFQKTLGLVRH